jgi:isoleucyl-tRNA synthetase
MDTAVFARAFAGGGGASGQGASVAVEVPSLGTVSLGPDDVVVTQTPLEGWGVATAGGETVALDLSLTADLRAEGLAREAIRLIQDARKNAGLDVTDRILLRWSADDPGLATALTAHAALVAGEVLATGFDEGPPRGDTTRGDTTGGETGAWHAHRDDDLGLSFWFARDPR